MAMPDRSSQDCAGSHGLTVTCGDNGSMFSSPAERCVAPTGPINSTGGEAADVLALPTRPLLTRRKRPVWRDFCRHGIPEYLAHYYWWAYLWKPGIRFFDHPLIINLVLFGQYRKLTERALACLEKRPIGRFLQLACVYGSLTSEIARRLDFEGLSIADVSADQLGVTRLKLAIDRGPDSLPVDFMRCNGESLAYRDQSFDTALLFFLLHELPPRARAAVLAETARVLSRGGRLVIVDYGSRAPSHLLHRLGPLRRIHERLEPFLKGFRQADLIADIEQAAAQAGTRVVDVDETPVFGGFYRVVEVRFGI